MQQKQPFINFEHELFIALSQIFPDMSVRNISKWAGKSSGYWSSISAQGRPVSTTALNNLYEYIECRKILLHHEDALHIRLSNVQHLIQQEIVGRLMIQFESIDYVWDDVSRITNANSKVADDKFDAMPFLLSRFR